MTGRAGVHVQVLTSQSSTQQGRIGSSRIGDGQSVLITVPFGQLSGCAGSGGGCRHLELLEVNPEGTDIRPGGTDSVGAGLRGRGRRLGQVSVVGAASASTAQGKHTADAKS